MISCTWRTRKKHRAFLVCVAITMSEMRSIIIRFLSICNLIYHSEMFWANSRNLRSCWKFWLPTFFLDFIFTIFYTVTFLMLLLQFLKFPIIGRGLSSRTCSFPPRFDYFHILADNTAVLIWDIWSTNKEVAPYHPPCSACSSISSHCCVFIFRSVRTRQKILSFSYNLRSILSH